MREINNEKISEKFPNILGKICLRNSWMKKEITRENPK